jgi:hypothetical protein
VARPSRRSPANRILPTRALFAGGFVGGRRLEIVIDLPRTADHRCIIGALATTRRGVSHRLRITDAEQLDASVEGLLAEAHETVGPGKRGLH